MSVLPFVYPSDPFFDSPLDFYRPRRYGFNPFREIERLDRAMNSMLSDWEHRYSDMGAQTMYKENGDFSMQCQTAGFKPEELSVDVDGDRLTVSGRHVESREGESVERHFTRMVRLPKELDQTRIKCELDEKGELIVNVPRHESLPASKQNVPIEMKQQ